MSTSLPTLNAININEVEMLKSIFGIKFNTKTGAFELQGSFSIAKLMKAYSELKNNIWSKNNIKAVTQELEVKEPNTTRIHYFGNGRPVGLDSFISKMGLLEHEILVEDPLCFPLSTKPTYKDHITKSPKLYVKHVFENALTMIYLEEWIRKGYVYYIPSLPLIDIQSFWALGKINEKLASTTNFLKTPGTLKSIKYTMVEGRINIMLEMSRVSQIHYTKDHIKKIFPNVSDDEAQARLKLFKEQTLEEREQSLVKWALDESRLGKEEELSLLSYFERTRPFNIERFLDVSKLSGGLMATAGMPLLQATYLAERFHCIPSTDNLGLMYGYEGWCQALEKDLDKGFERVKAKIDLPFTFLDKIPLKFIEKARERGKGHAASIYLDQEWGKIRQSRDMKGYKKAVHDFTNKVAKDFNQLETEHELMLDELVMDGSKSALLGLGAFSAFNLATHMPTAIIGGLSALIASSLNTVKSFRRSKNELQAKPLAVFLEIKGVVEK